MKYTNFNMNLVKYIFWFVCFFISCNEQVDLNNPLDPNNNLMLPTQLQIVSMTETSLSLTWKDNIHYTDSTQAKAIQIILEQRTDGTDFLPVDSLIAFGSKGTVSRFFLTNTRYYFRIYAKDQIKSSTKSEVVNSIIPLPGPTDLKIVLMTSNETRLEWKNNSNLANGFIVEMSTDTVNFNSIATVDSGATNASIKRTFDSTTTYLFRVCAKTNFNKSPYSNTVGTNLLGNTYLGLEFEHVDGGTFPMGGPNYVVTLSSYNIGKCEVTQKQWRDVVLWKQNTSVDPNPNYFKGDSLPVETV
jgi:hypothetical protein